MLMRTGRSAAGRDLTYEKREFDSFPRFPRVSREKSLIGEIEYIRVTLYNTL